MGIDQELKHHWCLHLACTQVSAGKLACIFARLQKGSPLSDAEIDREEKNATLKILENYEILHENLHENLYPKESHRP